jgi:GNAT superfamily N-acetyltransferase
VQNGGKELHLFGWYVPPHRQGHGIGAELVEDFLAYAWKKGFRTVRLSAGGEKSAPLLHVLDKATKDQLNIDGFRVLHGGGEGPGYATLRAA